MTSTQFLELAVSLSAQAALVVAATHWLGRLGRSERMRCRLWAGCFAVLLLLVLAGLLLPHPRLMQPWARVDSQTGAGLVRMELQLGRVLFLVWLVGAAVSLGLFVVRSCQAAWFLRTCKPVDPDAISLDDVTAEQQHLRAGSSSKKRIRLVSSALPAGPFCWQFHRPHIVLPEFLLGFDGDKLRFMISHELEHLRTGHPLQLFLQRLVEVLFWFHPLVWWASHRSALAREFACDDAAVNSPSDIAAYLRTLLAIVEHGTAETEQTPTSLAFGGGKNIIAERARRLVKIARSGPTGGDRRLPVVVASLSLVAAAFVAALVWLPVDVLASPRANWSPWPSWTSGVLHDFGVSARDFERYDHRFELHELLEEEPHKDVGREGARSGRE